MIRKLYLWLVLAVLTLVMAAPASASTAPGAENRTGVFDLVSGLCAGLHDAGGGDFVGGNGAWGYDVASGSTLAARGAANGRSLHHWFAPQRWRFVPQGIRNAGFNLVELPPMRGVFHRSLDLNRWMGFASRWGGRHARNAAIAEETVALGIEGLAAGSAYAGYEIGYTGAEAIWGE